MPTSAPGSSGGGRIGRTRRGAARARGVRGFTLIELLVVIAIVALSAAAVSLALRDGDADRLQREAERLSALLESARTESRVTGLPAWWVVATPGGSPDAAFRFVGLPADSALPVRWLDERVQARVIGTPRLVLGPEALIGPQRVELRLGEQRLVVGTDGLAPFSVLADPGDTAGG